MSQGVSMKRRRIDSETKLAAVPDGLKGESFIADLCRKYQISERLYYRWRDLPEIEEKIFSLADLPSGALRISWYLMSYHDIKISLGWVYSVLRRQGLGLPGNCL
jgi:hypothetical protein